MLKFKETRRQGWGKPLVVLFVCGLGMAGGWLAQRSHRTPNPTDPTSVDWSKPDSNPAPLREASPDKLQAEFEAAKQRAEVARPFIVEASKTDRAQLQSLMVIYSTALKPVREPPLLDLATVTQVEQLRQKKNVVQAFMKANEALRVFLDHREAAYREKLDQLGLPRESLESVMEAYRKTAAQPTALALKMRNDDDKMGTALLSMLDILDATWGRWTFDPKKQKVDFVERAVQEEFLDFKEELDKASLEQMACQVKLAALETTE